MKEISQKEQLEAMVKWPIRKKRVGIIRLQMIKESQVLYGMERFHEAAGVVQMMRTIFLNALREMIVVMSLDAKITPLAVEIVAVGNINVCGVDIAELFKHAILNNAYAIILLHNHPSGDTTFSRNDILLTDRVVTAGNLLGIRVLDHIVIGGGDGAYASMLEEKLVNFSHNSRPGAA